MLTIQTHRAMRLVYLADLSFWSSETAQNMGFFPSSEKNIAATAIVENPPQMAAKKM
jgi:hypothetical protein